MDARRIVAVLLVVVAIGVAGLLVYVRAHEASAPLEPLARVDTSAASSTSERIELDAQRESASEATAALEAPATVEQAPIARNERPLDPVVVDANPKVTAARILRRQMQQYEQKGAHTVIRGEEAMLMITSMGALLEAKGRKVTPLSNGQLPRLAPGDRTLNVRGVDYIYEVGDFPEWDAYQQRLTDQQANKKLYEVPMDPKVFEWIEQRARQALIVLESGN